MKSSSKTLISIASGVLIGAVAVWLAVDKTNGNVEAGQSKEAKLLYWVAPMDPNYKRDQPGKSPMGMDLIPVYEEGGGSKEVGTVTISPQVVNNLGVRTAIAALGQLDVTISTVGYVQYDEDRLVHIHPRVEGWVEKLYVKSAGDSVKKGEPLYTYYSPKLVNAQEELLLALKRNNKALIDAATERLLALQVSVPAIDQLKKSGKISQTITISAPRSGVLDSLSVREGMFVMPSTEMMVIGQLEHIWVIGEVFERQVASVKKGDTVTMRLDYLPGREWHGSVDYIYPSLNSKTRTAQVRVNVDNPDIYLRPGMFAKMVISTRPTQKALLIPQEALIRTGSQSRVVLAKGEGRFKSIAVEVGRIAESQVEILSGLQEGERVVTSAQFLLDSESSKTSDFKRMNHEDDLSTSVWVSAQIESSMPDHRMVTATHDAIEEWDWPAMTMDFTVAPEVDMAPLQAGTELHMQISRLQNGSYAITATHIKEATQSDQQHQEHGHD